MASDERISVHVLYRVIHRPARIQQWIAEHGWNGRRTLDGEWEETNCRLTPAEIAELGSDVIVLPPDEMRDEIATARLVAPSQWELPDER